MYCSGQITTDANGYPLCSGEWLDDGLSELLSMFFATPTTEDIQQAFMVGFGLPLTCYLTAWAFQSVIVFLNSRYH